MPYVRKADLVALEHRALTAEKTLRELQNWQSRLYTTAPAPCPCGKWTVRVTNAGPPPFAGRVYPADHLGVFVFYEVFG
jgi:hypothetical protein